MSGHSLITDMKSTYVSLVFVAVSVLDVLRVCQAVTCTAKTDFTCVKSNQVTGRCVDGVCECVNGTVPNSIGCHKIFVPRVVVIHPESWSGEVRADGIVEVGCDPQNFLMGKYSWYHNGILVDGKTSAVLAIRYPEASLNVQCSIHAYGVETDRSDPLLLVVDGEFEAYKQKPYVSGMPEYMSVKSEITLYCLNVPASRHQYIWKVGGETLREQLRRSLTLCMYADMFNKTVTCTVKLKNESLNILSEPVMTPVSPAADIPGVRVMGDQEYQELTSLILTCELTVKDFALAPSDALTYTWIGPDGDVLSGETKQTYWRESLTLNDTGSSYACTASFNGNTPKVSPEYRITVEPRKDKETTLIVEPRKTVLGGHLTLKCHLEDLDPTTLEFRWREIHLSKGENPLVDFPQYTDNVMQANDIEDFEDYLIACYAITKHSEGDMDTVSAPVHITTEIRPNITITEVSTEHHTYNVTCLSDYASPGVEYEWRVDGVQPNSSNERTLQLKAKVTPTTVKCRISFNSSVSSFSQVLTIPTDGSLGTPVIEVRGHPPSFIAGASYDLVCSSISHGENATYSWKKDGIDLGIDTQTLLISNIQPVNEGSYLCRIVVGNKSKETPTAFVIDVTFTFDIPTVEVVGNYSIFLAGELYTLLCAGLSREETKSYQWKVGDDDLDVNLQFLVFPDIQNYDSGNYTCVVTIGDVSMECEQPFSVSVMSAIVPPVVTVLKNPSNYIKGGHYSLLCSTPSHDESASYLWQKGNNFLKSTDQILNLSDVQELDTDNYTCTISLHGKLKESKKPLELMVAMKGKFCHNASDCEGEGFKSPGCHGLQCHCLKHYTLEGDKCVASRSSAIYTINVFSVLILSILFIYLL